MRPVFDTSKPDVETIKLDMLDGLTLKDIARRRGWPYRRLILLSGRHSLRAAVKPTFDELNESFLRNGSYHGVHRDFPWLRYWYVRETLRAAGVSSPIGRRKDSLA